jgi:diguanylate cyclase (GGDEF)-like protein
MFKQKQLVVLNLACAAAYCLAAYLGSLFALPPSGSSPIWPAAGFALAALLLFGKRILAGLVLGILTAQTLLFFDSTSVLSQVNSVFIGIGITIGACLQAIIGAWTIKKFVGVNDPLTKDEQILRFLALGGPISCTITATLSTVIFAYTHKSTLDTLFSNWLTWWIGDVMGVLIFTPLLLILIAQPRELWQSRRNYVLYPLLMLLGLVVAIFYYGKQQEQARIAVAFNRQTSLLESAFGHALNSPIEANEELKSFFDNSVFVSREEFLNFSSTLLKQQRTIKALEWIPRIFSFQRKILEDSAMPQLTIRELAAQRQLIYAKNRPVYFPIVFANPLKGNERALGFDVASNPDIIPALVRARDTGLTTATPRITLVQEQELDKSYGIVIYSPIYKKSFPTDNPTQRNQALRGFVASVMRVEDTVADIMNSIPGLQLYVKIQEHEQLLFSNIPGQSVHKFRLAALQKQTTIKVANHYWTLTFVPTERFIQTYQSWGRWWLLFGCLLFTSLTGMSLLMLTGRTLRTEELIKLRTCALRKEVIEREERSLVLHAVASSMPLTEVLSLIVNLMENGEHDIFCSILLTDASGKHLKHGASGKLPQFYITAVEGLTIADKVGSCATAAFLGQRVIIDDLNKHPYWANFRTLAEQAGLKTCWSEPIFSSENKVLGTLSVYYSTAKTPSETVVQKIEEFTQLASLAIEKNNAEQKIRYLAFYDTLTNLPNRRLLYDRLKQELNLIERHQHCGALLFLDLDHFKTLNDSLGHLMGDELLIQVAQRLSDCIRNEDTVARLGGDEFVVLLKAQPTHHTREQVVNYASVIAQRIQAALYIPYSLQGYEHCVTSSIGITLFHPLNKSIAQLFKQADTAMYNSKAKGRNTFSFYDAQMEQQANSRLELENQLQTALETRQFLLHYQPQYNKAGTITGAEALLYWQHPQKGLLAAAEFMPACEESGLILAIGDWVLKSVCQYLKNAPPLDYLAVNISLRQFQHPSFVQKITDIFAQYPLSPSLLMLEFTERVVMNDIEVSTEKLFALQALGVRICIDNFGTDYSSLVHLKHLPIDQLKIDRSFIHNLAVDSSNIVIIETMIMMAHHLGLHVIAEGVENAEQLNFLQAKHCHVYQGQHFSQPLTLAEFNLLLIQDPNPPCPPFEKGV